MPARSNHNTSKVRARTRRHDGSVVITAAAVLVRLQVERCHRQGRAAPPASTTTDALLQGAYMCGHQRAGGLTTLPAARESAHTSHMCAQKNAGHHGQSKQARLRPCPCRLTKSNILLVYINNSPGQDYEAHTLPKTLAAGHICTTGQ